MKPSSEVLSLKDDLIEGMMDYLEERGEAGAEEEDEEDGEEGGAGYTKADVDQCAELVDSYLAALAKVGGADPSADIMDAVRDVVLELNALNERCDGNLIETDQRELLCALILAAAMDAGLETDAHDITEEWREW